MHKTPFSPKEIEDLFREYYRSLCMTSFNIVRDMDVAKDIVQEFFVKYWEKGISNQLHSSFESYAHTAVKNKSLNFVAAEKTLVGKLDQLKESLYNEDIEDNSVQLDNKEQYKIRLVQAIQKLPPGRREVFLMSNTEGLKYTEIAERLNISVNTVKTQIRKAYIFLRAECGSDF